MRLFADIIMVKYIFGVVIMDNDGHQLTFDFVKVAASYDNNHIVAVTSNNMVRTSFLPSK